MTKSKSDAFYEAVQEMDLKGLKSLICKFQWFQAKFGMTQWALINKLNLNKKSDPTLAGSIQLLIESQKYLLGDVF